MGCLPTSTNIVVERFSGVIELNDICNERLAKVETIVVSTLLWSSAALFVHSSSNAWGKDELFSESQQPSTCIH